MRSDVIDVSSGLDLHDPMVLDIQLRLQLTYVSPMKLDSEHESNHDLTFKSVYVLSSQAHRNIGSRTELVSMVQFRHHLRKGYKQHVQISVYKITFKKSTLNVIRNSKLYPVHGFGWEMTECGWTAVAASAEQLHYWTASSEKKVDLRGCVVSDLKMQLCIDKHKSNGQGTATQIKEYTLHRVVTQRADLRKGI